MTSIRRAIAPVFLALCLILGGASASGFAANMILQIVGIGLIAWCVTSERTLAPSRHARLLLTLVGLAYILVVIQLVPLPSSIWSELPGRESIVGGLALLGLPEGWLPLSLAPAETVGSAIWLVPAVAILLCIVLQGAHRNRWLAFTIVGVALVSVIVGAVQIAGSDASPAYFYEITNRGIAVGMFANGNHFALLLVLSIPFIAALHTEYAQRGKRNSSAATSLIAMCAILMIMTGIAINGSLAGIGLAVPVGLASLLLLKLKRLPSPKIIVAALGILSFAAAALILFGPFGNNLIGAEATQSSTSRLTVFARTALAAVSYAPFGSGLGTFVPVYRTLEDPTTIDRFFMNEAHNDYLQLVLEAGLPGLMLMVVFATWYFSRIMSLWKSGRATAIEKAASIAVAAILIHSMVDYPLRTAAISCVLAACVAMMAKPREQHGKRPIEAEEDRGVHLTA